MKFCKKCNAIYSDEFRFCPAEGTALRSATESVVQTPASAGQVTRSRVRIRRWLPLLVVAIVAGALGVFTFSRHVESNNQADSQSPVVDERKTATEPNVRERHVNSRRITRAEVAAKPEQSRDAANGLVQQARVQQLVATGYRYMQQRDYCSARDSFEEALEIDPHNVAAQNGLKAAKTADSVEGVAGLFRR